MRESAAIRKKWQRPRGGRHKPSKPNHRMKHGWGVKWTCSCCDWGSKMSPKYTRRLEIRRENRRVVLQYK
jgi:hypothetical protein